MKAIKNKLQTPNPKLQTESRRRSDWSLDFGFSVEFEFWTLEFSSHV